MEQQIIIIRIICNIVSKSCWNSSFTITGIYHSYYFYYLFLFLYSNRKQLFGIVIIFHNTAIFTVLQYLHCTFYCFWSNKCSLAICIFAAMWLIVSLLKSKCMIYVFIYKTLAANQNFRYSQKVFSTIALKSHPHTFKLCIRNGLKTRKKQCVMMWKRAVLQVGDWILILGWATHLRMFSRNSHEILYLRSHEFMPRSLRRSLQR